MELNQRIDELEAEMKIVKNEVQTVLLDIRERVLSYYDNPFQVIEAKAGGNKGDMDASLVSGGDSGGASSAPAPIEQRAPEQARTGEVSPGAMKMEDAVETSQLKALADQMQLERQAMEQERKALEQAMKATQQTAQSEVPQGAPAQPGMPTQAVPPGPAQFQPMAQMMPQPVQPMMQQPFQQGPQPGMPSSQPVQYMDIQQRQRPWGPGGEEPGNVRGPSGGQGTRGARRASEGMEGAGEEGGRRTARRLPPGTRRPEGGQVEQHDRGEGRTADGTEVNLMTLIGLVRWVEKSIQKIGKERVEAVVEIYRTAGYLPSSYKDTIPQIIRLADDEKPEGMVTMGNSISVLLQLDSLLGGKFKTESAVLSTLFGDEGGYPWTKQ